jgi:hypothetical protein
MQTKPVPAKLEVFTRCMALTDKFKENRHG